MRTNVQIGRALQSARKARGLSQMQLAARVGLSQARISALELQPGSISVDQLLALCANLGLELTLGERKAAPKQDW
jgi:HTH-type transcriptional regulator/antitoxin HipB